MQRVGARPAAESSHTVARSEAAVSRLRRAWAAKASAPADVGVIPDGEPDPFPGASPPGGRMVAVVAIQAARQGHRTIGVNGPDALAPPYPPPGRIRKLARMPAAPDPRLAEALTGSYTIEREIRILARLQRPHVLPLHDSCEAGVFLYHTMPFVDGASLRERLDRDGGCLLIDGSDAEFHAPRVAIDVSVPVRILNEATQEADVRLSHEAGGVPSPDGQWVALAQFTFQGNDCPLAIRRVDGTESRVLSPLRGNTASMAWLPDSRSLAFEAPGDLPRQCRTRFVPPAARPE